MTTVEDLYSSVPIIQCAKCGPGSVITLKLVMAVLAALQVIIMSHVWFYVVGPTDVCGEYMWKVSVTFVIRLAPRVCKMDQKLGCDCLPKLARKRLLLVSCNESFIDQIDHFTVVCSVT